MRRPGARIVDPMLTCSKFVRQLSNVAVARKVVKVSQPSPEGLVWGIRAGFRDYLDSLEDARVELVDNVTKLQSLELKREKSEVTEELEALQRIGDPKQEDALLQQIYEKARRAREREHA